MEPRGPTDEEGVVDPKDLDITKNEEVRELRDGQYVIATDESAGEVDLDDLRAELEAAVESANDDADDGDENATDASPAVDIDPRRAIVDHVESLAAANGVVVVGRFDGSVSVHEGVSNELGPVFGDLLAWYARNVDRDTPAAEVLGILCLAADRQVRYPVRTLVDLVEAHGLSPDDSIRDLLTAVREEGLVLPVENDRTD